MPDLSAILDAIRDRPDKEAAWLTLAGWLWDKGRDDEAAAVRVFWPTFRDNVVVAGVSLAETLRLSARHAKLLGRRAREIEGRRWEGPADE